MFEEYTLTYKILYRNGIEDIVDQEVTEENHGVIEKINGYIETAMQEDIPGMFSLGNDATSGTHVRLSDVTRVAIEVKGSR